MASAGGLSTAGYTHDGLDNLVVVKQGTLYTYDDNGNLLSRQDARGATRPEFLVAAGMTKAYDGLGRPRRRRTREGAFGFGQLRNDNGELHGVRFAGPGDGTQADDGRG